MNIPKELVDQWEIDWQDPDARGSLNEYIAQRAAEWALSQPVSMEPVGEVVREGIISWKCKYPPVGTKLYTATQLAQARQHGAEEELKEWEAAMVLHNNGVLRQRIAELEQKNAQLLEALKMMGKPSPAVFLPHEIELWQNAIADAEVKP